MPRPLRRPLAALLVLALALPALALDWPQWRGPERQNVSKETGLLPSWPAEGPPVAWLAENLGGGYSAPSVAGGKVFLMSYRGGDEIVLALDEKTGKEIWATPIARQGNVSYNEGPRGTPTVDGDRVYCVGVSGDVACLTAANGKPVWERNFAKDFGGKMMSGWGFSESPLVDGNKLICTPGGDAAALVALNKTSGKTLWAAKVPGGGGAGYSSPVKATVGKTSLYINWLGKSLVGVDAAKGTLLWTYDRCHNDVANIPTPIVRGNLVFASTGYGAGSALLELVPARSGVTVKEKYFLKASELQNHHGGMVLLGEHVYCGHGHNAGQPRCVELKTGKVVWDERGPGSGSAAVTCADGKLYFRYQNGVMALIEATPEEYRQISEFKLPHQSGKDSWPHPVVANGRLFVRDQDKLICFDVSAR